MENTAGWSFTEFSLQEYDALDKNAECFMFDSRYKSKEYHKNRYFLHPMYKYRFYALKQNDTIKAIMVLRESPANGGNCLRLVEYIGDYNYLANVKGSVNDLLREKNYEYMESDPDTYMSNGPALSGVFEVGIRGNHIERFFGSYWWDL